MCNHTSKMIYGCKMLRGYVPFFSQNKLRKPCSPCCLLWFVGLLFGDIYKLNLCLTNQYIYISFVVKGVHKKKTSWSSLIPYFSSSVRDAF